jgi:CDGSH-type Zn-finger protein
MIKKENKIIVSKDGPYLVSGNFPLEKEIAVCDGNGIPLKWKKEKKYTSHESCALCRCGKSEDKPFCDGSHVAIKFDGTETANNKKFLEQCVKIEGPDLILRDAPGFCSSARFCHRNGDIWDKVQNSDAKSEKIAIDDACDCPSGRLIIYDKKTGKPIEPKFQPSISLTEDGGNKVLGPIWVKGNIPIESYKGKKYEIRNRVTLCRCGKSENKPFCDGTHIEISFGRK